MIYHLYPGYACNAKCLFCFNPAQARQNPKDLTFPALAREIYRMSRLGHRHMTILGGEPTVRGDLPEICALAKKTGFLTVAISTNGIRTADAAYARSLSAAGLDLAIVSAHGHTPRLHDKIVGVPGAFEKISRTIENFSDSGVPVQIAVVLHRLNHARLPDFFRHFLAKGVRHFTILSLRYHGHMGLPGARQKSLRVSLSQTARSIHEASRIFLDQGLRPPLICHMPPCILPGYESQMDDLLSLSEDSCDGFYLDPQTRDSSSERIDHKGKIKLPRCRRCVSRSICPGVEKDYLKIFGDEEIRPLREQPRPFSGVPL